MVGDVNLDVIALHGELPQLGGESIAEKAYLRPGGSAANVAHALALLGVETVLLACVGEDDVGLRLVKQLHDVGVDTGDIQVTSLEPTGIAYIVVTHGGERTMLTYRGANKHLDLAKIPEEKLRYAKLLHISGYCISEERQEKQLQEVFTRLSAGTLKTLDFCKPLAEKPPEKIKQILRSFDYILLNMHELETLGRVHGLGLDSLVKLARRGVVLKKGRLGCEALTGEGRGISIPAPSSEAKDATGAGDAFAAGLIYGLLNGLPLEKCCEMGNRLGALAASTIGGRLSQDAVKSILRRGWE